MVSQAGAHVAIPFDPHTTAGNAEHFTGVAQIPLGFAGPITIHGEHARGEFAADDDRGHAHRQL